MEGDSINLTNTPEILTKSDTVALKRKVKTVSKPSEKPGVVYLGRIPHGFYEQEMKAYFSQFGTVSRLRLSRNKKTGASKHYAFIEFENDQVAKIVAETMNNYLLANHLLKCQVVDANKLHENVFKNANKPFKIVPTHKIQKAIHNKEKTPEQFERRKTRMVNAESTKNKKLKEVGIDYEF
ncbi:hypothetical protein BC833DRAFT_522469, partial [Globomyces pollinis-pini]